MHNAALMCDNQILTWGVNDYGALDHDTSWDGAMVDMDRADSNSDSDENTLNPKEATPATIGSTASPQGTVFTNDGIAGFSPTTQIQAVPILVPGIRKVTKLAAGNDHILALNADGTVLALGSGEQNQMGRRVMMRNKTHSLLPRTFGLRKGIVDIGAGAYHSFAIHRDGTVYGWGLNSFGETGVSERGGESEASVLRPTVIQSLKEYNDIKMIRGGNHHSIALTERGDCLFWGQVDNYATGLDSAILAAEAVIFDARRRPRILTKATPIPGLKAVHVATASDHVFAVTGDGQA
ncbi:MAG: hypothetical protein M1838_000756 [Thelocarpon superellum]|nr:MAG: hypothetical protein M1838_000756 [Thelocarpon superellum]